MVANNDEKKSFSVTYVPKVAGLHKVGDTNTARVCHRVTALSPRVSLCQSSVPMCVTVSLSCPHTSLCHCAVPTCVTELSPHVTVSLCCPHMCH